MKTATIDVPTAAAAALEALAETDPARVNAGRRGRCAAVPSRGESTLVFRRSFPGAPVRFEVWEGHRDHGPSRVTRHALPPGLERRAAAVLDALP